MTAVERFQPIAAQAVALAAAGDVSLSIYLRQQLANMGHWALPVGWTDGAGAWVLAMPKQLESPNKYRFHWTALNGARAKWEQLIWATVAIARGCASVGFMKDLGRAPKCSERMAVQIIRLVPSVRNFLKDDDNRAYSAKPVHDSLKRVGLIKEDRREWLTAATVIQDVSPFPKVPVTIIILRPAVADLFTSPGAPACSPIPSSSTFRNPPATSNPTATSARRSREPRSSLIP